MQSNKRRLLVPIVLNLSLMWMISADKSIEASEIDREREQNHKIQSELDSVLGHMRMVVKNGIKVKGTYSYSDGEYRRTIYYIAENKGYRITGEDIIPLNNNQKVITDDAHKPKLKREIPLSERQKMLQSTDADPQNPSNQA